MMQQADDVPYHRQIATFDRRAEAWGLAHALAPVLVRLHLTPEYGMRVFGQVIPGRAAWYRVEICGPAPLPAEVESTIRRALATKESNHGT